MHPSIKIVSLLIFAIGLSIGSRDLLPVAMVLLAVSYGALRRAPSIDSLKMFYRLRWILFSLLLVYLAMTPGIPLIEGVSQPTEEGLFQALHRILILLLLVLAIDLLLKSTSREELIRGMYWLSLPMTILGIDCKRAILRLVITLDLALAPGNMNFPGTDASRHVGIRGRVRSLAEGLQLRFVQATQTQASYEEIVIETGRAPKVLNWSVPLLLAASLFVSERFL